MVNEQAILTEEDLVEIYYALETKLWGLIQGDFGPEDKPGDTKRWVLHLKDIQRKIEQMGVAV